MMIQVIQNPISGGTFVIHDSGDEFVATCECAYCIAGDDLVVSMIIRQFGTVFPDLYRADGLC
jgi:hypothetical protein